VGIAYTVKKVKALYAASQKVVSNVCAKVRSKGIALNKLRGNTVYVIENKSTRKVEYVGRTCNFAARQRAHQRKKFPKSTYNMYAVATGLTLREARVYEQCLICAFTIDVLKNSINSISPKKFSQFKSEYRRVKNLMLSMVDPE
jgi:hypothetical protein